jgi:hypothetical protein
MLFRSSPGRMHLLAAMTAALLFIPYTCRCVSAAPKLELRPESLDFGSIEKGEKVRKTLQVRNAGDADLVISVVRASCAECVVDKIKDKTLKPGEEIQLPVTYDATAVPGKHPAYLTFETNDPADPFKRLEIDVEIVAKSAPALECEPASIDVGIIRFDTPAEVVLQLKNTGEAALKFEEFSASPGIALTVKPGELAAGRQEELKLNIAPKEAGIYQAHVTIATNDPNHPVATIPIRGYVASREQLDRLFGGGILIVPERAAAQGGLLLLLRIFNYGDIAITVRRTGGTGIQPGPETVEPGHSVKLRTDQDSHDKGSLPIEISVPVTSTNAPPVEKK